MTTKHTPGRWEIVTKGELLYQVGVVHRRGTDLISAVYNCNDEAEANARLIAAAPEMLALLHDCESYAYAMATLNNSGEGAQLAIRCRAFIAIINGDAQ